MHAVSKTQTVIHLCTNWAQHGATLLITMNALTTNHYLYGRPSYFSTRWPRPLSVYQQYGIIYPHRLTSKLTRAKSNASDFFATYGTMQMYSDCVNPSVFIAF